MKIASRRSNVPAAITRFPVQYGCLPSSARRRQDRLSTGQETLSQSWLISQLIMGMISGTSQRTLILFSVASGLATTLVAGPVAENNLSATTNVFRPGPDLRAGKAVYEQHCAACHGVNGDGNGPAAVWLYPKPRNFNSGLFKIKSTPAGFLPTDEDLFQTVTRGMPGSSMPSFTYLTEARAPRRRAIREVADRRRGRVRQADQHVRRGQSQGRSRNRPMVVPPEPPRDRAGARARARSFTPSCIASPATARPARATARRRRRSRMSGASAAAARFQHRRVPRRPHRARSCICASTTAWPARRCRRSMTNMMTAGGTLGAGALRPVAAPQGRGDQRHARAERRTHSRVEESRKLPDRSRPIRSGNDWTRCACR